MANDDSARIKTDIQPLFATPVAFASQPNTKLVSAALREIIHQVPDVVLMFPSWLSHKVQPYTGKGARNSIAMNLS
jgi:hypothetical protein